LATICVPISTARSAAAKLRSASAGSAVSASSRIRSSSGSFSASSRSSRCVPAPRRTTSAEPQAAHVVPASSECPQWWQRSVPSPCRTSETSQKPHRGVVPQARQWSVEEQDRLAAALGDAPEGGQ
jgi:hypothetical protein